MGNCLVTKLKESVNNQALLPIGSLLVHYTPVTESTENDRYFIANGATNAKIVNNVDNCHFTDFAGTANYGTELDIAWLTSHTGYIAVSNGTCDLIVEGKYGISSLDFYNHNKTINGLSYIGVNMSGSGISGSIGNIDYIDPIFFKTSKFYNYTVTFSSNDRAIDFYFGYPENIHNLKLNYPRILNINIGDFINIESLTISVFKGNIPPFQDLFKLVNLSDLTFTMHGDNIPYTGHSVEEFVQGQRTNGRTTNDSLNWKYIYYSGLTFDGEEFDPNVSNIHATISWTSNTITVVYNGVTKTINA